MSALGPRAAGSAAGKQEPEWVVVLLVVALLLGGLGMKAALTGEKVAYENGVIAFSHPAGWNLNAAFGSSAASGVDLSVGELIQLYGIRDIRSKSTYKSELGVLTINLGNEAPDPARMALSRLQFAYTGELAEFKVLATETVKVSGVDCILLKYAFVADPNPDEAFPPVVVEAAELIVPVAGKNQVMIVRVRYDSLRSADTAMTFERILASLSIKAGK
ncbi:MAG: hypothetical protein NT080_10710 [Spirochaetes bacterium]|nr:hypothetical protein [Spirochaetota bacterium]